MDNGRMLLKCNFLLFFFTFYDQNIVLFIYLCLSLSRSGYKKDREIKIKRLLNHISQ